MGRFHQMMLTYPVIRNHTLLRTIIKRCFVFKMGQHELMCLIPILWRSKSSSGTGLDVSRTVTMVLEFLARVINVGTVYRLRNHDFKGQSSICQRAVVTCKCPCYPMVELETWRRGTCSSQAVLAMIYVQLTPCSWWRPHLCYRTA